MCIERQREGRGPACATVCPTRCIVFGGMGPVMERVTASVI
ncbi:MAG: hypothetical protein NTU90_08735 [Proteobacteria bacterium]|nr:hypothetical protein [Pseudomonadota bacterium]